MVDIRSHQVESVVKLAQVVRLSICDHRSLGLILLSHRLDKLLRLILDIERIHALLVKSVSFLLLYMCHLVFEIVLDFLILSEL